MDDKPVYVMGRVLTAAYASMAGLFVITGVILLLTGTSYGWLLFIAAAISVLFGYVKVSQYRQMWEQRASRNDGGRDGVS